MASIKFLVDADLNQNALLNAAIQSLASAPGAPVTGQIYWDTVLGQLRIYDGAAWVNLETIDLAYTASATTGIVTNTGGDNATIPVVTPTAGGNESGLMIPGDKTKLDAIEALADVTDATNVDAAGAVMETDISAAPSGRIIDDDTMATASATTLATSESIKAYVDGVVLGGMIYKGGFDPTASAGDGSPDLDTITSVTGDTYTVTAAGTYNWTTGSAVLAIGDVLVAESDGVLNNVASWTILEKNIADIVSATDALEGIIELANQTEVNTGTDATRAVTPDTLEDKTMGTYTGTTITDNVTLKTALQELETAVEAGGGSPILEVTADTAAATTTVVTHNFNTRKVQVDVHRKTTPWDRVITKIDATTVNSVTVTFNTATTAGEYEITVRAIDLT